MNQLISNTQADILEYLARFKFLVISQMQPLVNKSAGYIRQQLAELATYGYIKSYQLDRPGKSQNMYYLTEAGKDLILSNGKPFAHDIKLPIGVPLIVRDYQHRKHMIDVQISLFLHLTAVGINIADFICYFDKSGANRKGGTLEAKTKIALHNDDFFIPDAIMVIKHNDKEFLYLLEMYCDRSVGRPLDQIKNKHLIAISLGTPGKKFEMAQNPFVLSVFEHENIMIKMMDKLKRDKMFQPFANLFFFASLSEIQRGHTAWRTINNDPLKFT